MDKRYQIFVSSTFTDLVEERRAAQQAILQIEQIPAGMELFPASDETAWELIKGVIDLSDFYVLIIGGRYGSTDDDGVGFTEKEYDHAVSSGKPVIALLAKDPNKIPREKTDKSDSAWKQLEAFRAKVEKKHTCVYWSSADELSARVITGVMTAIKKCDAVGWVRGDQVPSGSTLADVLALKNRIAELEDEAEKTRTTPPADAADYEQGNDSFSVRVEYSAHRNGDHWDGLVEVETTWNSIFAAIAPTLIQEASEYDLHKTLSDAMAPRAEVQAKQLTGSGVEFIGAFKVYMPSFQTCIVQLRALGLIRESVRTRRVSDANSYWRLTPYGDFLMTQLRARRRKDVTHP